MIRNIQVNPSGAGTGEGSALSIYLLLNANERVRPYEKIYVRAQLRVLNQRASPQWRTIERPRKQMIYFGTMLWTHPLWLMNAFLSSFFLSVVDHWFTGPGLGWGYNEFIPLADLRDPQRGYLVNDVLIVQVEMEIISTTRYFPS